MILLLKEYCEETKRDYIYKIYTTEKGVELGTWVYEIRRQYTLQDFLKYELIDDTITYKDIQRVFDIRISGEKPANQEFQKGLSHLETYVVEQGTVCVPVYYRCKDGFELGAWCQRRRKRRKFRFRYIEGIRLLRDAGFTWDANGDYWNHMYDAIQQVNESEATECWKKTAKLYVYSPAHELSKYQIRKLKEIGIEATSNSMIVECLEQYHKNFGIRNLKYDYVNPDGIPLGKWLYRIVKLHKQNKLKDESAKIVKGWGRILRLDGINNWMFRYSEVRLYKEVFGDLLVSPENIDFTGENMYTWISGQRGKRKRGYHYSEEQIRLLQEIGI